MIKVTTVKWAVRQPNVRGSFVGAYASRDEAQAVADAKGNGYEVSKWTVNEFVKA